MIKIEEKKPAVVSLPNGSYGVYFIYQRNTQHLFEIGARVGDWEPNII
jgi:hypothetical protein